MSQRFEKLFSGQVYRESGPPVDPVGAFRVDAGLLHTLLSLRFRYPTDAWRQIMSKALGPHEGAMKNEKKLLEIAGELQQAWTECQEGPLNPVLKIACRIAFENPTTPEAAEVEALAASMTEGVALLVGMIREVVDQN